MVDIRSPITQSHFPQNGLDQSHLVALRGDIIVWTVAEKTDTFPQKPGTERVECTDSQLPGSLHADEFFQPVRHFPSGFVGERDGKDSCRSNIVPDEVRHATRYDPGLPGAGSGKKQERAFERGNSFTLFRIQAVKKRCHSETLWRTDGSTRSGDVRTFRLGRA